MKTLKISVLSDSFFPVIGGREKVIDELCKTFIQEEHICKLYTGNLNKKKNVADNFIYPVFRCPSIKVGKDMFLCLPNLKMKKDIETNKFDILHVHTKYALCNLAIKKAKKLGIPVVTTVHTNYIDTYTNQLKFKPIIKFAVNRVVKVLNKVDGIIAVSSFMKNQLLNLGVTKDIIVIPNGNDILYEIPSIKEKEEIKKSLDIKENNKVFITVGEISERKNLNFLLNSLAMYKKKDNNFVAIFIGQGDIKKYESLSKSLGIEDNVRFLGKILNRQKLAKLYAISDLHLFPSICDSFGLVLREAAAMGTPSLVIDNTATSEDITNNVNGYISKNNYVYYANKLYDILYDKSNLITVSDCAKKTLAITWKEVANKTIDYYHLLIERKKNS